MSDPNTPRSVQYLVSELNQAHEQVRRLQADLEMAVSTRTRDLAAGEARYRSLIENLQDILLVLDADGHVTHIDGNLMGIAGYTPAELMAIQPKWRFFSLVHPEDLDAVHQSVAHTQDSLSTQRPAFRLRDKAGECRWVEATLTPLHSDDAAYQGMQVVIRDVSDRVQAERVISSLNAAADAVQLASRSPEQVIAAVVEQLDHLGLASVIALIDDEQSHLCLTRVHGHERALCSIEGIVQIPRSEWRVSLERDQPFARAVLKRESFLLSLDHALIRQLLPQQLTDLAPAVLGALPPLQLIMAPMSADDQVFGVLVVLGERLPARLIPAISAFANQTAIALLNARLMSSLQESERRYRGIFEAANDGLLVFDAGTHRIAEANAAACTMYGYPYEKMLGLGLHRLATPERHHHLAEMIRDIECHGYHACQSQHVRHNGDEFPVEIEGMRLTYRGHPHLLVVVTDITERIEAQQTMVNAERLRALGQMAGGIAHDFNNILVSIRGYADMARLDMHEHPDALTTDLDQIIVGADDAAEAVRRLQSLYRQTDDTSDFVPIQLDDIVTQATSLTRPRWKDQCQAQGITIQIHTELLAPPVVLGNPSELRRLLTNLLVNAIDAMPGGGDITIATGSDEHGSYMLMRDAGIGIPPEQLARIFDPFFSTKKSSGLGLTVSKNIVERHGGNIEVTSLPGRGTTFTVHLPISAVAAVAPALPEPIEGTPSDRPRLSVLVVDDEAAVRQLLTRFIEREGHEVTTVASGREALQRLDERVYDLLITDLGMPDMSGHEVTHHAHERSPHMPTVLITGWGETITPEQLAKMNVLALLPKPFSHKDLGALLRHVHSGKPLH